MNKLIKSSLLLIVMMVCAVPAKAADEITPEFAQEGIEKAIAVMDKMAAEIDALEPERADQLQYIINSIDLRKCRKKYGKIELTDEMRTQLVASDLKVSRALLGFFERCGAPMDIRQQLAAELSEENVMAELAKNKTLRDYLSVDM